MPPKGWRKNKTEKSEPVLVEKKEPEPLKEMEVEIAEEAIATAFPSFDDVRAAMMEDEYRRGRPGPHGRVGTSGLHDSL